jgi:hypothetical protein
LDHSDQTPALAILPEQRYLCEAADGPVASVLRRVNIHRPRFAYQSIKEMESQQPASKATFWSSYSLPK